MLRIAMLEGFDKAESQLCSTAGLLHDIGKIVLAQYAPEDYNKLVQSKLKGDDLVQRELELFGTTHSEVGGYLLGLWGLPGTVVDTAIHHKEIWEVETYEFNFLVALQIANDLVRCVKLSNNESNFNCLDLESYCEFKSSYLRKKGVISKVASGL